jgi:methionine aminotransferase
MIAMKRQFFYVKPSPFVIACDDYILQLARIEKACSSRTKMIIINNPHNPTGKILTKIDFEALDELLLKFPNIILLSDEVYEYITFEEKHISAHTRTSF